MPTAVVPVGGAAQQPAPDDEAVARWRDSFCTPWADPDKPFFSELWRAALGPGLKLTHGGIRETPPPPDCWIWHAPRVTGRDLVFVAIGFLVVPLFTVFLVTVIPQRPFVDDEHSPQHVWAYVVTGAAGLLVADFQSSDWAAVFLGGFQGERAMAVRLQSHALFMVWIFGFYELVGFPPVNFLYHGAVWTALSLFSLSRLCPRSWRDKANQKLLADVNTFAAVQVVSITSLCTAYLTCIGYTSGAGQVLFGWGFGIGTWAIKRLLAVIMEPTRVSYVGFAVGEFSCDTLATVILASSFGTLDAVAFALVLAAQIASGLLAPTITEHLFAGRTTGSRSKQSFSMGGSPADRRGRGACRFGLECMEHIVCPLYVIVIAYCQRSAAHAANFSMTSWSDEELDRCVRLCLIWSASFAVTLFALRAPVRRTMGHDPIDVALKLCRQHYSLFMANVAATTLLYCFITMKQSQVLWFVFPETGYES